MRTGRDALAPPPAAVSKWNWTVYLPFGSIRARRPTAFDSTTRLSSPWIRGLGVILGGLYARLAGIARNEFL
jgi:hypothetical protein